jgi:hypothetical protein
MKPTTPTYVVECYWPAVSKHQAMAVLAGNHTIAGGGQPHRPCVAARLHPAERRPNRATGGRWLTEAIAGQRQLL